jgi:hypothetical protein
MGGLFSLGAQTGSASGTASNLGCYRVGFGMPVSTHFDVNVGYTLIMSEIIGGDLAFGLDLGTNYFPLTQTGAYELSTGTTMVAHEELWRPYVGLWFHQRQFQSVRTNYSGFGLATGFERALRFPFDYKIELRYTSLVGASGATATEINFVGGLTLRFK